MLRHAKLLPRFRRLIRLPGFRELLRKPVGRRRIVGIQCRSCCERFCHGRRLAREAESEASKRVYVCAFRIEPGGSREFSQRLVESSPIEVNQPERAVQIRGSWLRCGRHFVGFDCSIPIGDRHTHRIDGRPHRTALVAILTGDCL